LAPVSEWRLETQPDRCRITRDFGKGENRTELALEKGLGGGNFNLVLTGALVDSPYGEWTWFQFLPNEQIHKRNFVAASTSDGRSVLTTYGATFTPAIKENDGTFTREPIGESRQAAIETLAIALIGSPPFQMEIGAMDRPVSQLDQCIADKTRRYAERYENDEIVQPTPINNPGEWLTSVDFPMSLRRDKASAVVKFSLVIDQNGTPTFCQVRETSRPYLFDEKVCKILIEKARFEPARDQDRNPVAAIWPNAIRFQFTK